MVLKPGELGLAPVARGLGMLSALRCLGGSCLFFGLLWGPRGALRGNPRAAIRRQPLLRARDDLNVSRGCHFPWGM